MTFDLEKARDLAKNPIHCPETDEIFADAITEIERLRADNAGLSKAVIDIAQERDLAQAEFRAYYKAWEEQAARIQELEEALVEAKAAIKFCLDEGDEDENYGPMHDLPEWRALPEKDKDIFRDWCREQLQAEGKIGPDANKPRSWQITDERKAAFVWILRRLEYDQSLPGHTYYKIQQAMELLRTMLEEAGQ